MTARKPTNKTTSRTTGSRRRTKLASKAPKTIDLQAEDVTDQDDARLEVAAAPAEGADVAQTVAQGEPDDARLDPAPAATDEARAEEDHEDKPASDDAPSDDPDDVRVEEAVAKSDGGDEAKVSEVAEEDKPAQETKSDEVPAVAAPVVSSHPPARGGFGSGLVGGLLGGVAVVAASYIGLQQGMISLPGLDAQKTEQQALQLADVKTALSGLEGKVGEAAKLDLTPLEARLAELEAQVKSAALQNSEPATSNDTQESDAAVPVQDWQDDALVKIDEAVAALSQSVAGQVVQLDGLTQRLEGLEGLNAQFSETREQLTALEIQAREQAALVEQKAVEQTALLAEKLKEAESSILSSADRRVDNLVTDLSNLSAQLGEQAKALTDRVTSLEENNLSETMQSSAQTIALAGLENAVASGANYQLALETFAKVAADHPGLEGLKAHASTGVPTKAMLAKSFGPVYDAVLREAEDAGAATLLDKFLLNAQNLVRVRSLSGEKKGESLTNKLGVIDYQLRQGDLAKVAEEWDALPAQARDAKSGADWVKGLKARIAVDAAMDGIRADFGTGANATAQ